MSAYSDFFESKISVTEIFYTNGDHETRHAPVTDILKDLGEDAYRVEYSPDVATRIYAHARSRS